MKYGYLLLSACFFFLASCTADSEDAVLVTDTAAEKLVKQTISTGWSGHTVTSVWNYNGKKIVSIVNSDDSRRDFTYDGDLIVNIENKDEFGGVTNDSFVYDTQGRVIEHYDISEAWGRKETYEYLPNGIVNVARYMGTPQVQDQLLMTATMEFVNGEVTRTKSVNAVGGYTVTCNYTYDSGNSPTRNIIGYDRISALLSASQKGIYKNVSSNAQSNGGMPEVLIEKTFQYDSQNFPIEIVSSDPLDGDSGTTKYKY